MVGCPQANVQALSSVHSLLGPHFLSNLPPANIVDISKHGLSTYYVHDIYAGTEDAEKK